jgi:hypothetical protein
MPARQQESYSEDSVLVSTAAITSAGATATVGTDFGQARALVCQLSVGTVSGTTPSMTVLLEDSVDGSNWNLLATFAAVTTTGGKDVQRVTGAFAKRIRARVSAVTGTTPSFSTVTVTIGSRT